MISTHASITEYWHSLAGIGIQGLCTCLPRTGIKRAHRRATGPLPQILLEDHHVSCAGRVPANADQVLVVDVIRVRVEMLGVKRKRQAPVLDLPAWFRRVLAPGGTGEKQKQECCGESSD